MTTRHLERQVPDWRRHFFYRKESLHTTWKLRLSVLLLSLLFLLSTRGLWTLMIGRSLICDEQTPPSDALLVENFDPSYVVFKRTAALQRSGVAPRVLVPVLADDNADNNSEVNNMVSKAFAEVMARVAHVPNIEMIPIQIVEPISLNAAKQIRDFLTREHIRSVVVATPDFRSRRSLLVYSTVLNPAGISVGCVPAFGSKTIYNWSETWHGIQAVAEEFLKLQYYRFYVLL
jgi:hypothetical protein